MITLIDRNLEPKDFIPYFEEIAGEWNGDNPGRGEERTKIANEIVELLKELQGPTKEETDPAFDNLLGKDEWGDSFNKL